MPRDGRPRRHAKTDVHETACQDGCSREGRTRLTDLKSMLGGGGGGGSLSLVVYVFVAECVGTCVGIPVTEYGNSEMLS